VARARTLMGFIYEETRLGLISRGNGVPA
jgi:hypothetical protein